MTKIPHEVLSILTALTSAGFEAFVVGGCVRDMLMGHAPKDWDITTSATPEKIQKLFPESFYENTFGTVTIKTKSEDVTVAHVEITPYRIEGIYTDKRHPDEIRFAKTLEEDLSRRDFTINAISMDRQGIVHDPYGGQIDIRQRIVRTVGNPEERFGEDALRILRAVRFATVLDFTLGETTRHAIEKNHGWLHAISKERVRDEFVKIIESPRAYEGMLMLHDTKLLEHIVPELLEGIGVEQNLHHIYTVWEHNLRALKYTVEKEYSLAVRLGALLHDVGKPQSKRGVGRACTFYGHEVIGARITAQIMDRLKFSKELSDKAIKLVRWHLFYYNVGEVTESSVRRLMMNVGHENVEDLLKIREADRIGSGTPKAIPYKLRHLKYIIDKVSHDPISVKMLKINGNDLMAILGVAPGPKIGLVLNSLLAEVLDDPEKNTREYLEQRARELAEQSPEQLRRALEKINEAQQKAEEERMRKYHV
ncbi:MAG: HD domain-containing protein [Patescibacteria group bacterium]